MKNLLIIIVFVLTSCASFNSSTSQKITYNAKLYLDNNTSFHKIKVVTSESMTKLIFTDFSFENINSVEILNSGEIKINDNSPSKKIANIFSSLDKSNFILLNQCFKRKPISSMNKSYSLVCDDYANIQLEIFDLLIIEIKGVFSMKLERRNKVRTNVK